MAEEKSELEEEYEDAEADLDGVDPEENDLKMAGADPKMTIYRGLKDFTKCPTLQRMELL